MHVARAIGPAAGRRYSSRAGPRARAPPRSAAISRRVVIRRSRGSCPTGRVRTLWRWSAGLLPLAAELRRHGQLGATLAAPARENLAPALRRHAGAESVLVAALPPARLIRALHGNPRLR